MRLLDRVKAILLHPKSEWKAIDGEPGDAGYLLPNYVMILAAIPPVCTFIGTSLIGFGPIHVPIVGGIAHALISYVLGLVGVFVLAYVIDFLAGMFDGRKNLGSAMKVAAYAPTAGWVAGVFGLIPALSVLSLLGLYSVYLLHTGIATLMKPPAGKAVIYTIAVIVVVAVMWLVVGGIVFAVLGVGTFM